MPKVNEPYVEVEFDTTRRQRRVSVVIPCDHPTSASTVLSPEVLLALNERDKNISRAFLHEVLEAVFPLEDEGEVIDSEPWNPPPGKPKCFNRQDYETEVLVTDGDLDIELLQGDGTPVTVTVPHHKVIPDPMSKECMQHKRMGEATLHNWDCKGCKHLKGALRVAEAEKDQ